MLPTLTFSVGDTVFFRWFDRYYSAEVVESPYPDTVRLVTSNGDRYAFDPLTLAEAIMDAAG